MKKLAFVLLSIAVVAVAWSVRLLPYQNSGYVMYLYAGIALAVVAAVAWVLAKD